MSREVKELVQGHTYGKGTRQDLSLGLLCPSCSVWSWPCIHVTHDTCSQYLPWVTGSTCVASGHLVDVHHRPCGEVGLKEVKAATMPLTPAHSSSLSFRSQPSSLGMVVW